MAHFKWFSSSLRSLPQFDIVSPLGQFLPGGNQWLAMRSMQRSPLKAAGCGHGLPRNPPGPRPLGPWIQVSRSVCCAKVRASCWEWTRILATHMLKHGETWWNSRLSNLQCQHQGLEHFASAGHSENIAIWSSIQSRLTLKADMCYLLAMSRNSWTLVSWKFVFLAKTSLAPRPFRSWTRPERAVNASRLLCALQPQKWLTHAFLASHKYSHLSKRQHLSALICFISKASHCKLFDILWNGSLDKGHGKLMEVITSYNMLYNYTEIHRMYCYHYCLLVTLWLLFARF